MPQSEDRNGDRGCCQSDSAKPKPAKWNSAWTRRESCIARSARFSLTRAKLAENAHALIGAVLKAKPAAAKGKYVKKITLTSTMGPGITIDLAEAEALAAAA